LDIASLGAHSTSLQQAKLLERSNSLRRRIEAWTDIQHLYIPSIAVIRARADQQGGGNPVAVQDIELLLPSALQGRLVVPIDFLQYEWELRLTHAEETLAELRSLLLMRSMMYRSKERHMRGQKQQTKGQNLIKGVQQRVHQEKAFDPWLNTGKPRIMQSISLSSDAPGHPDALQDALNDLCFPNLYFPNQVYPK
jgi:hypothetical protein